MNRQLRLAVILAGASLLAALPLQAGLYKWVDEEGEVHYSDSIPPRYAKQHYQQLSARGIEVRDVERAKTAEEIAAEQQAKTEEAERLAREQRLALEQSRKDQILLDTFTVERDIILMRDDRLGAIASNLKLTEAYNAQLKQHLDTTQQRIDVLEKNDREVPVNLRKKAKNLAGQLEQNETYINRLNKDKILLEKQFADDLARFRELKGITPPAEEDAAAAQGADEAE